MFFICVVAIIYLLLYNFHAIKQSASFNRSLLSQKSFIKDATQKMKVSIEDSISFSDSKKLAEIDALIQLQPSRYQNRRN